MKPIHTFRKTTAETKAFGVDWSDWLGTDTIATSSWVLSDGMTGGEEEATETQSRIDVSGGTDGSEYELRNLITTVAGRTDARTVRLLVGGGW